MNAIPAPGLPGQPTETRGEYQRLTHPDRRRL
jgi:hypothetical protein